ncbi:hypothetical protein GCM10009646_12580 [Streptomyces aureus]
MKPSTRFLGVNVLAPVLTDEGRADLAYKLPHQNAVPSWLHSVDNGATTVWERWSSCSKDTHHHEGSGPEPQTPGTERWLKKSEAAQG